MRPKGAVEGIFLNMTFRIMWKTEIKLSLLVARKRGRGRGRAMGEELENLPRKLRTARIVQEHPRLPLDAAAPARRLRLPDLLLLRLSLPALEWTSP